MSVGPATAELRAVLEAPRGRRFSRPGASTHRAATQRTREQRVLTHTADNTGAAHRQNHGAPPLWAHPHVARWDEQDAWAPERPREPAPTPNHPPPPRVPRPRPAPDDGPFLPRPERPPLPRRPRRPHSHRKPRRSGRTALRLAGYALAAGMGALAHHLTSALL